MTSKHFKILAEELVYIKPESKHAARLMTWKTCVKAVARACKKSNPNFDEVRFLEACNYHT